MISVFYAILMLPFAVLGEDLYVPRSPNDDCFDFSNDTLLWETGGYALANQANDGNISWKVKSSVKFYGGLTPEAVFEGGGGLIGVSMVLQTVSNPDIKCPAKPRATTLLVIHPSPLQKNYAIERSMDNGDACYCC